MRDDYKVINGGAMQKTLTVRGQRFTAAMIDAVMSPDEMTNGDDYIITLNGDKYYTNYRQIQEYPFAPTCERDEATAIALMPDDGHYRWLIWLEFDPSKRARDNTAKIIYKQGAMTPNGREGRMELRRGENGTGRLVMAVNYYPWSPRSVEGATDIIRSVIERKGLKVTPYPPDDYEDE